MTATDAEIRDMLLEDLKANGNAYNSSFDPTMIYRLGYRRAEAEAMVSAMTAGPTPADDDGYTEKRIYACPKCAAPYEVAVHRTGEWLRDQRLAALRAAIEKELSEFDKLISIPEVFSKDGLTDGMARVVFRMRQILLGTK